MWRGESGKLFHISDVSTSRFQDAIAPFENVCHFLSCQFKSRFCQYNGTLFRFPLRTTASELSENTYTVDKLHELLEALKSDGKLLLLFLRSVITVEVHEIFANGRQKELFCVSVKERDTLAKKRKSFMEQVRHCHTSHGSSVNKSLTLATEFHVNVTNEERSHWLVVTQVGSEKQRILTAAAKQHVLPWVGTALQLESSSPGGRVFCFLPMPVDASCPLPVHVNGTFALNSNRRTLKWPGVERRNDPEAEWNQTLVSELLPSCYDYLISKVQKVPQSSDVYSAWPDVNNVKLSNWSGLLSPLFALVFSRPCIKLNKGSNNWSEINEATFLPEDQQISEVVITTVTRCNLNLAKIPGKVWRAFKMMKQNNSVLFPALARSKLRQSPHSYQLISRNDKLELLCYCLSDQNYSDLHGIYLLPLANGKFVQFQSRGPSSYFVCTQQCPYKVFPNESVDNVLVNVVDDADLMSKLELVAKSKSTQLQKLTIPVLAKLVRECFPSKWESKDVVTLPHRQINADWLERFWNWVQLYDLSHFCNLFLVPIDGSPTVRLTRLPEVSKSSILLVDEKSYRQGFLSALVKLGVHHTSVKRYSYLCHKDLSNFMRRVTPEETFSALFNAWNGEAIHCSFSTCEAYRVCSHLSSIQSLNSKQQEFLSLIPVFQAINHKRLFSVSDACQKSWKNKSALEPKSHLQLPASCLPSNIIVFKNLSEQSSLIDLLTDVQVSKPYSALDLILDTLLAMVKCKEYPADQLITLMKGILKMFFSFQLHPRYQQLIDEVREMPFLSTTIDPTPKLYQPSKLFDPDIQILKKLYEDESVFPLAPFNTKDYLPQLRECGLCQTVSPQGIIDIIWTISESSHLKKVSNIKLSRARAILEYLKSRLSAIARSVVNVPGQHQMSFTNALCYLAQNRCWLPIRCSPPDDYSSVLSWKGCGYKSHFLALNKSSVLLTHKTASLIPHLAGSQVLIVDHTASAAMYDTLEPSSPNIQHVLAHFKQVIECKKEIDCNYMNKVIEIVYNFLNKKSKRDLHQLSHLSEWIWLQKSNKFISPAEAAMRQNLTFQQNLEPFLYVLPDGLSNKFFDLFNNAGVCKYFSKLQVVSVLQKMHDGGLRGIGTRKAWRMALAILNWLTEEGMEGIEQDDLFVPIQSETKELELKCATKVVYTGNEFLKEYLTRTESEESYTLVHSKVRPDMAKALGLTPLSQFLDISEDTFEDAGQCEPLTTRLKNILKDYKDGLTIIKELLQNADDAEATEVNICYDARVHSADPKKLFFPGMADSHGPALIVHNNKTFSDDDFKNITQLAGGTKQNKPLKIGKFGIGFCSVYHITDVPSFVSRNFLYIFDPTLKHLQKAVSNPARPGKKLKFTKKLISTSQQLQPYTGLFGFNPRRPYDGTMFRLPFRKAYSEISSTLYSESTVKELLKNIKESSSNLLLFLQHVKKITFSRFDPDKTAPTQLLEICLSNVFESVTIKLQKVICGVEGEQYWLNASHSCSDRSERYFTASVACSLEATTHQDQQCFKVKKTEGEIFCFLPLSLKTGLPVHVSSNFAVMNNRRGIWTSSHQTTTEVEWNISLMKYLIPFAYHKTLLYLHNMHLQEQLLEYSDSFYTLWPVKAELLDHNPWDHCVDCFYQKVFDSALFYSAATSKWLKLDECKFVDPCILCLLPSQQIPQCVYDIIFQLKLPVVNLPQKYQNHFSLDGYFLTEEQFVKIFFDKIESVVQESRNETLFHMFEVHAIIRENNSNRSQTIDQCLKANLCVPCSPDGCVLRLAQETVDPNCLFSGLFDCSENRFPLEKFCSSHLVRSSLVSLGMTKSAIPWSMLAERAQSIVKLYYNKKALERSALIIKSIRENLAHSNEDYDEKADLASIPFIPVLQKPSSYLPLPWGGEGHQFLSGDKLMTQGQQEQILLFQSSPSQRNIYLAGSQVSFVCTAKPVSGGCGLIPYEVQNFLKVCSEPNYSEVINHLKKVILLFPSKVPAAVNKRKRFLESTTKTCNHIYGYLNSLVESSSSKQQYRIQEVEELKDLDCVWTGQMFVSPKMVAENWKSKGPYLFTVPECLANRRMLASVIGVKEMFSADDLFKALFQMHEDYREAPVSNQCKTVICELIPLIQDLQTSFDVVLPDKNFIIRKAKDLSYNDAPWCPFEKDCVYVHDYIPRKCALNLGVKPVRSRRLEVYSSRKDDKWAGVPFGQHEELTQRIQNILRDYPFDATFLKELLQNADDAKATKMYVILDKRHHRTKRMISEEWKDLQGPALLVWNDSIFSEKDIQGIQHLGLGSKRSDSDSIGQYGIGFNVVYHVTDCPSFVSNGETLCILDPHCRYVPEANSLKPGRRLDNLKSGFWNYFSDLKSAYLQDDFPGYPKEVVNKGSLFRFPLRHTNTLMRKSRILPSKEHSLQTTEPLTADYIQRLINYKWDLKEAFFFLNHIREFKFFIIENNSVRTEMCYQVNLTEDAVKSCAEYNQKVKVFTAESATPHIATYCVEMSSKSRYRAKKEKWLIQQGIGDIEEDEMQEWKFIHRVKPRHGLAAPLVPLLKDFTGSVFCFLPLPIRSGLPVHVNGNFILDSSRRALWNPTSSGHRDERDEWNKKLLKAISSSYAKFLVNCRSYFIKQSYKSKEELNLGVERYYGVFPRLLAGSHKESATSSSVQPWLNLARDVYMRLSVQIAKVLACVTEEVKRTSSSSTQSLYTVHWKKLKNSSIEQVHFSSSQDRSKRIESMLKLMGMNITCAPYRILIYFKEIGCILPETKPDIVFEYYKTHFARLHVSFSDGFPCLIEDTAFKSNSNFKKFSRYLLKKSDLEMEFPSSPFNCPLLLTADNVLRIFDEKNKVIVSEYSSVFQHSLQRFLCQDLLDLSYSRSYFLDTEDSKEVVHKVLNDELPAEICDQDFLASASQYFVGDLLKKLWICLRNDSLFCHHLPSILERWPLLLTETDELYSLRSSLLPVISSQDEKYLAVTEVLRGLGMPFLNQAVVKVDQECITRNCPCIKNCQMTLLNLVKLHRNRGVSFTVGDPRLATLISYLGKIHFLLPEEKQSVTRVKQLPLFENINENLTAISNETAYVWPCNIEISGCDKWLEKEDIIFLNRQGEWRKLASSPSDLLIEVLAPDVMYTTFIFRHFHLLNKRERYKQLLHIRDNMFSVYKAMSETSNSAYHFVSALKTLPCLGEDGEKLRPVSDFCNPDEVFRMFAQYFITLPKHFLDDEQSWINFFSKIGLKMAPSKEEFIKLCCLLADGKVKNPTEISSLLLQSILGRFKDKRFLSEISEIPFVLTTDLSHLTWVLPAASPSKYISIDGEQFALTKLHGAATTCHSSLLWTVRPIVRLHVPCARHVLAALGIVEPNTKDVIQNIKNISSSRFANMKLFDTFPDSCLPPQNAVDLFHIVFDHFNFFKESKPFFLEGLSKEMCIPVSATLQGESFKGAVLVRPQQVILADASIQQYHPFLNPLPSRLTDVLSVLGRVGVEHNLQPSHLRLVLELAFKSSEGFELDMNTKVVVENAMMDLFKMLQDDTSKTHLSLSPLYLLDHKGKLSESSEMFYLGWLSKLQTDYSKLEQNDITVLHLPLNCNMLDTEFCSCLPIEVQPKSLPKLCKVVVPPGGEIADSHFAQKLRKALHFPSFRPGLLKRIKANISDRIQHAVIDEAIITFCNIEVIVLEDLNLNVLLRHSVQQIGTIRQGYHFEQNKTLYIDLKAKTIMKDKILDATAKHMVAFIFTNNAPSTDLERNELQKLICFLLKAESDDDMRELFTEEGISIPQNEVSFRPTDPELGKPLPKCMYHRLDQDYRNLFKADEWVGYEVEEDKVIFAKVAYPVMEDCDENGRPLSYVIYTSEEDEEGKKVSVLEIYKFIRGKVPSVEASDSQELEVAEGIGQSVQRDVQESSARDIKREVCKELKRIWQLPENERKTAIRRLYLMWHPDKNPNRIHLAEDVFKYLQCQIERLQKGLPLLDPDEDSSEHFIPRTRSSSYWYSDFQRWNSTAEEHRSYRQKESDYRAGNSAGYSSHSNFWDNAKTDPVLKPEEGRRWLRQAEEDFKMLLSLTNRYNYICFMAHQVAEKALKAGMYAICGLCENSLKHHRLTGHACNLHLERPTLTDGLSTLTHSLESYYLDTRYPNRHPGPTTIPSDVFTSEQAREARESAKAILGMMKRLVV